MERLGWPYSNRVVNSLEERRIMSKSIDLGAGQGGLFDGKKSVGSAGGSVNYLQYLLDMSRMGLNIKSCA